MAETNSSDSRKGERELSRAELLDLYKFYATSAETISGRRHLAHSFFLTLNTAIFGYFEVFGSNRSESILFVPIAGLAFCIIWYFLIKTYKKINSAKFKVINEIEENFSIRPYSLEWDYLKGPERDFQYNTFTSIEILIPIVFFGIHFLVLMVSTKWPIEVISLL